jgi:hypothetical protein
MFRSFHRWLKKKPTPHAHTHHPSKVEFLADQDGPFERELKARWSAVLKTHPTSLRAYLAQVRLSDTQTPSVALIVITTNGADTALLGKLAAEFKGVMASSQFVDVLFFGEAQESRLSNVCRPFYAA